jgi:hypothetical protein
MSDDRTVVEPPGSYVGYVQEDVPMIRHAAAVVVALTLSTSPLHAQNAVTMTVNEASANVHKSPSVGSPVIGKAPRGTAITVTRQVGDWVKVSWPSSEEGAGYVRASALTQANAAAAPAKAAPTAASKPASSAKTATAAGSKTAATPAKATTSKTAAKAPAAAAEAKAVATVAPAPVGSKAAVTTTTPAPEPISARSAQVPVTRPSAPTPARTLYVAPSHIFGVGMVAGGSSMGFGGSARMWKKGRVGLQLEASRYSFDSVDLLSRATTTDIAPGLLFALNDRVTDSLWVRPYLGIAAHLARTSRTDLIFPDANESASTVGARMFLGGEFSLASVPQFALSADVGYYKLPEPFVGLDPSGMGFSISGHWYVK